MNTSFLCAVKLSCLVVFATIIAEGQATGSQNFPHLISLPVNNYFLYQLIDTRDPLTDTNLESILLKIFKHHSITHSKVDFPPVVKSLRFKVKYICQNMKKCKGGHQLKKYLQKLKNSDYMLKFSYKTDTPRKRKLEENVNKERKKRKLLETEVSHANEIISDLAKTNQALFRQVEKFHRRKKRGERGKAKLKETYSEVQRRRNRRNTVEYAKKVVETLRPCGISPVSLSFKDGEGRSIQVDFQGGGSSVEEECSVERALFIKDKFNISRRAYHELAQSCHILPSQSVLSKQVKELNKTFEVMEIDGKYTGVYQSITERLIAILGDYIRQPEKQHLFSKKKVRVKISGDGTKIGKRIHVLNFVFSIVGENSCAGEKGSYLVGIVKVPEKYLPLKEALGKIIQEVNNLDEILLGNESYSVEFYLGGDLKFLNLVLGIDGFGATYSCLWCKCPAKQRYDTGKTW